MLEYVCLVIHCVYRIASVVGSFAVLSLISWKLFKAIRRHYVNLEPISAVGKAVLITGCDSGFGHRLAIRLNELGFMVYATVLDADSDGAKQLRTGAKVPYKMRVIKMNVTSDEDVASVCATVREELNDSRYKLWSLVNNAGIAIYGSIEWGSIESFRRVIEVNTFGLVRTTRAFLPLLRESKGRIVNMSSIGARIASRVLTAYCMSKLAANSFSDALRREMARFGIKVSIVEPSAFKTQMITIDNMHRSVEREWNATPEPIRSDYGHEYLDVVKQKCVDWEDGGANSDIDIVVDDMIDAIRSEEPLIMYRSIGYWKARLVTLFVDYLPTEVIDRLVEF